MKFLLDVNVLVAWGWQDHADHHTVCAWLARCLKSRTTMFLTSAIPQLGFVRVSVQRTAGQVTPDQAGKVLAGMLQSLKGKHRFPPDDQTPELWPALCQSAAQTTDAHFLASSRPYGAVLATLDRSLPGATPCGLFHRGR